jgi:cation diffusion facilitator CzcD-associated flavoprotein CzcO
MTKAAEQIDTVIIGGGQAGLAISYYLEEQTRPHVIIEQARCGKPGEADAGTRLP